MRAVAASASAMSRPAISACVITLNEADRIEACLAALAFCDDIVLVDSGSSDATRELAARHGARVFTRAFDGYRAQKDFAVQQARHDWILCVDADERISAELRASIEAARDAGFVGAHGYRCARATRYFGEFLRHGNAYPDRVLRLFDRRHGGFRGTREIHEHVEVDGAVALLQGDLLHEAYRSLDDQLARYQRYARMMAAHLHAQGRRARLRNIVLNPAWRFLRGYVLRGGFRDGWRGLFYAYLEAGYVRQKFLRLWLLRRGPR
ncbi:MAG: glycosyltransferase family 2 protein [Metallibacterium scheffleri]|uniref:glycosyltransferase family 2 protein n=1 Tax=Metallibacterium scheffleri TaxID=993689 RepID=UPI0026ECAA7A|nr:glycosyltransferase family 2 protein [Metallibacterium scheffleri]MCK9366542.1 glycosyltransferase family 2 protein [Metallibacterium scheffleri]